MKILLLLLPLSLVCACHTAGFTRVENREERASLDAGGSAYLALPEIHEVYGTDPDTAEQEVLETLASVFEGTFSGGVSRATESQTREEALAAAREAGSTYVVISEIFYWSRESYSFLNSHSDQVLARLAFYAASSGELADAAELRGGGENWVTGGKAPKVLRKAVDQYVAEAF